MPRSSSEIPHPNSGVLWNSMPCLGDLLKFQTLIRVFFEFHTISRSCSEIPHFNPGALWNSMSYLGVLRPPSKLKVYGGIPSRCVCVCVLRQCLHLLILLSFFAEIWVQLISVSTTWTLLICRCPRWTSSGRNFQVRFEPVVGGRTAVMLFVHCLSP